MAQAQALEAAGDAAGAAKAWGAFVLSAAGRERPEAVARWAAALRKAGPAEDAFFAEAAAARRNPSAPWPTLPKTDVKLAAPTIEFDGGTWRRLDARRKTLWSLHAFDEPRGWQGAAVTAAPGPRERAAACGPIFALTLHDAVLGVAAESGQIRWRRPWPGDRPPRVQALAGAVWIVGESRAAALDPLTGDAVFDTPLGAGGGAAAGVGDALATCLDRATLSVRDARTGKERWRKSLHAPTVAAPRLLASGGVLLAMLDGFQAMACDAGTGAILWQVAAAAAPTDDFAWAIDGEVWTYVRANAVECRRVRTGAVAWRQSLNPDWTDEQPRRVEFRNGVLEVVGANLRTRFAVADGARLPAN